MGVRCWVWGTVTCRANRARRFMAWHLSRSMVDACVPRARACAFRVAGLAGGENGERGRRQRRRQRRGRSSVLAASSVHCTSCRPVHARDGSRGRVQRARRVPRARGRADRGLRARQAGRVRRRGAGAVRRAARAVAGGDPRSRAARRAAVHGRRAGERPAEAAEILGRCARAACVGRAMGATNMGR